MKMHMTRFMIILCIATTLVLNVACANRDTASIWRNSKYGSSTSDSVVKTLRPVSGYGFFN